VQKVKTYVGQVPRAFVKALFTQWTNNAAMLSAQYPDDEDFDEKMEMLVGSFDAIEEAHQKKLPISMVVFTNLKLPNFEIDDSAYGEEPPF